MFATGVAANPLSWPAIHEKNLRVLAGSPLDFSQIFPAQPVTQGVVVRHGHLFHGNQRIRFLAAVMPMQKVFGGVPTHTDAREYAVELRRRGYNLVRFVSLQDVLMSGRKKNFDYDPVKLDRLFYLLAELKKQGIFWEMDIISWENGAFAKKNRYGRGESEYLRSRLYYDPEAMKHWQQIVRMLFLKKNPYTNMSTLADPALAVVTLVNENDLLQTINITQRVSNWLPEGVKNKLNRHFQISLLQYKKTNHKEKTEPSLFDKYDDADPLLSRLVAFATQRTEAIHQSMSKYLRSQGYHGLITADNNDGGQIGSAFGRVSLDLVTMHAYHDHPAELGTKSQKLGPKRKYVLTSSLKDRLAYLRHAFITRQKDKPFILDEYNHAYPNPWRREAGLLVPAFAAWHDWDGIARFARPVELAYGHTPAPRQHYITAFGVGMDPVSRAGEVLAALVFRRGDVPSAKKKNQQCWYLDPEEFDSDSTAWQRWPDALSLTGLEKSIAVSFRKPTRNTKNTCIPLHPETVRTYIANTWKMRQHLPTSFSSQYITLNQTSVKITSKRTEALALGEEKKLSTEHLAVRSSGELAVSVSSLDMRSVAASHSLLMTFVTDARSSHMDMRGGILRSHGELPVRVRPVTATITLKREAGACAMKLYALSLRGQQQQKISLTKTTLKNGQCSLQANIDIARMKQPSLFFHWVSIDQ